MKLYKKQLRPMIVSGGVQGCATTKTPLLPEHIWFDEEIVTDEDKLMWETTIKNKDAYASLSMECRYLEVEDTDEEKARIEYEPDMDRCHFIKSEYFIDTEEYVDWYIYNNVKIKVIKTYLPWRYEVIYDSKPYVYLSLDGACKFIENNITLHWE